MFRATLVAILLMSSPALADVTPKQKALAEKTVLSWNAFTCSVLAERKADPVEQERLFLLGYEEGMTFLRALEAEELTRWALIAHAAVGFINRLTGPSHDFRLGRVFEAATEDVYSKVLTGKDKLAKKFQAENEFRRRNCNLLR